MIVKIYTNDLPGGWEPEDLQTGLGGSEESIILFADELKRQGFEPTVYHTPRDFNPRMGREGVQYIDRANAECRPGEIWISWKSPQPFGNKFLGDMTIHWTADVERPHDFPPLFDAFVNLSKYHSLRQVWLPQNLNYHFPLGVDIDVLEKNRVEKDENLILYCDSPDRGLPKLLEDWSKIKAARPELKLAVTYGFKGFDRNIERGNLQARQMKEQFLKMLNQPGIELLGQIDRDEMAKMYWRAKYWCLPLERPDAQLFSLNAMKARHCGALPVVRKIAALREVVGEHIPYFNFVAGKNKIKDSKQEPTPILTWEQVVDRYWIPLFNEIMNQKKRSA